MDYNKIDWAGLKAWVRYVAMDANGMIDGYENEPKINLDRGVWIPAAGNFARLTTLNWTNLPTDYAFSLRVRPAAAQTTHLQENSMAFDYRDIPWSLLDDQINFVAVDADGGIYGYKRKPVCSGMMWAGGEQSWLLSGWKWSNVLVDDWKNSLQTRPTAFQPVPLDAPVDTPVWVKLNRDTEGWLRRNYAGGGKFFSDRTNSWTGKGCESIPHCMVLAQGEQKPPDDWWPGK